MACERYQDLIQEHLDRALEPAENAELLRHVERCSQCRMEFRLYRRMLETVEALPEAEAPSAEISANVMAAVGREPAWREPLLALPSMAGLRIERAAAVAAAALVSVLLYVAVVGGPVVGPRGPVVGRAPAAVAPVAVAEVPAVPPAPPAVPRSVARLQAAAGEAAVLRHGDSSWRTVSGEVPLGVGDRVQCRAESVALLYDDQARLIVRQGSELQVLAGGVRVRAGSVWIKVRKAPGARFFAETPNAVASVRGTVYTVSVDRTADAGTHVNVFEGAVEVRQGSREAADGEAVLVSAGQCVDVVGQQLGQVASVPRAEYAAYSMPVPADVVDAGPPEPVGSTVTGSDAAGDAATTDAAGEVPGAAGDAGTSTAPAGPASSAAARSAGTPYGIGN